MNFNETPEFLKGVKRLSKKWRSIPSDIEAAKKYITPLYKIMSEDVSVEDYRRDFFNGKNATILKNIDSIEVVKMRLDVADLSRKSTTRIIFIAIKSANIIHFVELYAKSGKEREDVKRINKYLDKLK